MVSKSLTTEVFDYDSEVDKETKGKLITLAGQVKRGKAFYVKNAIEIGCALHEAHELLAGKGRDGKFRQWFECECGLEKSTAYNYLNSFNAFSKFDSVAQLSAGAMYELALPSTPPAARKEAMKRASQGVKINRKVADEIIGEFTVDESPAKEVSNVGHLSKPQASVTGTPATSTASSPDLPSVGTVNRTESGSQGSGDAGECPKGGEHDWDDGGTCDKCLSPDGPVLIPPVVPIDSAGFDPANIAAHAESFAANFAAKVKAHNLEIERFARSIMEAFANPPKSVWLDESRLGIALDQIKSACATIRQAKAHDKPCPKCDGKGTITGKPCKRCLGVGYMPERTYEMAGGQ